MAKRKQLSYERKVFLAQLAERKGVELLRKLGERDRWPELSNEDFAAMKPVLAHRLKTYVDGVPARQFPLAPNMPPPKLPEPPEAA